MPPELTPGDLPAPRRLLSAEEMHAEMSAFITMTGLKVLIPDPGRVIAVMTAFGVALQDIDAGSAKTCTCDPCVALRASLATIERLMDEYFPH